MKPIRVVVAGAALLGACNNGSGQQAAANSGGPNGGSAEERVIPVEVAVAELGTASRLVTSTGTIEPLQTVTIRSQMAGAVRSVVAEEGDRVRPGSVLARIDSREIAAQLNSAKATLDVAQRAADRAEQLRKQEIITVAEYERDLAARTAAEATYDQLRTRVGYATVRAPIGGVVLRKSVETGDVVANQAELFTVADISTLVVRLSISELDVIALDEGDTVDVLLDALPGRTLDGRIRRIFPSGDPTTRLVPVEVALTGAAAREARPGFLARVNFELDPRDGVLLVPAGALVNDAGGNAAFTVSGGKASRRQVKRGGIFQGRVEIVDGLAAGDSVVVAGNTGLRDGARIRVVQAPTLEVPAAARQTPPRSVSGATTRGTP
jgi:membrane fusion protein (multidrug efflux system)